MCLSRYVSSTTQPGELPQLPQWQCFYCQRFNLRHSSPDGLLNSTLLGSYQPMDFFDAWHFKWSQSLESTALLTHEPALSRGQYRLTGGRYSRSGQVRLRPRVSGRLWKYCQVGIVCHPFIHSLPEYSLVSFWSRERSAEKSWKSLAKVDARSQIIS